MFDSEYFICNISYKEHRVHAHSKMCESFVTWRVLQVAPPLPSAGAGGAGVQLRLPAAEAKLSLEDDFQGTGTTSQGRLDAARIRLNFPFIFQPAARPDAPPKIHRFSSEFRRIEFREL